MKQGKGIYSDLECTLQVYGFLYYYIIIMLRIFVVTCEKISKIIFVLYGKLTCINSFLLMLIIA